jgi:ubiquinone/menaquinone biosynthesis C-methylase UbiE
MNNDKIMSYIDRRDTITKSEISEGYDKVVHKIGLHKSIHRRCLNMYKSKYKGRIIDIGCGGGHLLAQLNKRTDSTAVLFGLDISEKLCKIAKEKVPTANIIKGDAEVLPFAPDTFDFAFMIASLEHMQNFGKAILEVSRVLKQSGVYIVLVPNRDWLQYDFYNEIRLRKRFQPVDDHWFHYEEIKKLLESNHFVINKYQGSDCLFYYGWKHKFEQAIAFFLPFLYKKMKHHIFMCINTK